MKNMFLLSAVLLFLLLLVIGSVFAATIAIRPETQGFYSDWNNVGCSAGSSEWQCVDETIPNNATDYVNTSTSSVNETFNFTNANLSVGTVINNISINYYAMRDSTSRNRINALIRSGGVNYVSSTTLLLGSIWAYSRQTYTKNPATGTWWTAADVDGLEAGMRSYTTTNGGGRVTQIFVNVTYNESLADMIISNITFNELMLNGSVYANVTTTTKNAGSGGAASSITSLIGISTSNTTIPVLVSGASSNFTWLYNCTTAHNFTAIADVTNTVLESDETNNNAAAVEIDCII